MLFLAFIRFVLSQQLMMWARKILFSTVFVSGSPELGGCTFLEVLWFFDLRFFSSFAPASPSFVLLPRCLSFLFFFIMSSTADKATICFCSGVGCSHTPASKRCLYLSAALVMKVLLSRSGKSLFKSLPDILFNISHEFCIRT